MVQCVCEGLEVMRVLLCSRLAAGGAGGVWVPPADPTYWDLLVSVLPTHLLLLHQLPLLP